MKTRALVLMILTLLAFSTAHAQDLPPQHRRLHSVLKGDGTVTDVRFIASSASVIKMRRKSTSCLSNSYVTPDAHVVNHL